MIELVFSACLIAQPANCKDVSLTYEARNVTPFQCAMTGQTEMAKWIEGHPKWRVAKFRCGQARFAGIAL